MLVPILLLATSLSSAPAPAAAEPQIDWFKGDVQAAFDLARKEKKPLFLYWGAVWCPPCNQIKKTIFTRREFIEKTRLFLPVYLDGDTESAQTWGEKLGASGYPTMIVYSPEGKEILRLPMGLQVEEFNSVLDQALGKMTPIGDLLRDAIEAKDATLVPDSTWRVLAYYSWSQDEALKLSTADREQKFRALEARIPARLGVEKSRLFCEWLDAALERAEEEEKDAAAATTKDAAAAATKDAAAKPAAAPFALSADEVRAARARVVAILDSPELTVANLMFLSLAAKTVVAGLEPEKGDGRRSLEAAWDKAMRRVEADATLSVDERLTAVYPAMSFHVLDAGKDAPYPPALQQRVRERVQWADQNTKDPYTRQSAMNTAAQFLDDAGLKDEARKLLQDQLDKAVSPHYFMSHLAAIEKAAGNKEAAVGWMLKAYEASKGRATRFQWGTSYLTGLMDLMPEAGDRIRDESIRVLKELLSFDDSFAGRNQARLKRLTGKYKTWNAKDAHADEIAAIKAAFASSCAGLADKAEVGEGDSPRLRCTGFFDKLGSSS